MKYSDYRETIQHGTFEFPIAYYAVDEQHPRYEMMFHWHPEHEIIHIRKGQMRMDLEGDTFIAEAGDTVIINDGVCHSGSPVDCVYECLVFDLHSFMQNNQVTMGPVQGILNHKMTIRSRIPRGLDDLDGLLDGLLSAMRSQRPGYALMVQGGLYQLLGIIVREQLYGPVGGGARRSINQQASLRNAVAYIEEHYADRVTLDDLARAAGMNRKYFCSFFRSMTKRTPMEYLNFYRVKMASEQLLGSNRSISEIAGDCGFNDVSYFTKMFHRYVGDTPGNYRRK